MDKNYNISGISNHNGAMIGVILVLILSAILAYVKPSYFKFLFKSFLGNLIVAFIIIIISIVDIKWGIGLAAVSFIIYQAFQISCIQVEGFSSTCKPGCVAPTVPAGNCKAVPGTVTNSSYYGQIGTKLSCPWECSTDPSNYNSSNCTYNSECTSCTPPGIFDNPITPSTACFSSEFGCCPGGNTSKIDNDGSNCSTYKESNTRELTAACFSSEFGCCPNGITASVDTAGSNCSASGVGSNPWDNNSGSYSGYSGSNSGYSGSNSGYSGSNSGYSGSNSGYSGSNSGYSGSSGSSGSNSGSSGSNGVSTDRGLFPEGYPIPTTSIWPPNVIKNFVVFQKIHNPNLRFDLDILQKQATAEEVEELMKIGKWPWSTNVQNMYKQAIAENNIIKTQPGASLENAQTVYNQAAIVELLSWNSKEGTFLLNGAIIGHTPDMPENINNLVRCGKNSSTGDISMQKIQYTGYNGIYGNMNSTVTPVKNSDLPTAVNGFKFLESECNPCVALSNPADYSCPFSLNTGNGTQVSPVWQKLWGVDAEGAPITDTATATATATGAKKTTDLKPEDISDNFNKTDFPLLNQLKNEIMKSASFINVSFKKPTSGATTSQGIGTISGSSVPAILGNDPNELTAVNYGPTNFF